MAGASIGSTSPILSRRAVHPILPNASPVKTTHQPAQMLDSQRNAVSGTITRPSSTTDPHSVPVKTAHPPVQMLHSQRNDGVNASTQSVSTTTAHPNGLDGIHLPTVGAQGAPTHVAPPIQPAGEITDATLIPKFLRMRFVPHRHQVAVGEVDRELLLAGEKDVRGASLITALTAKKSTDDEKEETWNRLNELTAFAMVGMGFFAVSMGAGMYNRERTAAVLRKSATERDALWDSGIRSPFGNQICQRVASLEWGTLGDTQVTDDVLRFPDCYPTTQTVYDSPTETSKKMEVRTKKPATLASFLRCVKEHIAIWCVGFGPERREGRTVAVGALGKLREPHSELFTIKTIVTSWEEMPYRSITEMKECARKMAMALPETARGGEFRRMALTRCQTDAMEIPNGIYHAAPNRVSAGHRDTKTWR